MWRISRNWLASGLWQEVQPEASWTLCCLIRFDLAAGAVGPFVEAAGRAFERGDKVARVEATRGRFEPGNGPALASPRAGSVIELGEAAHPLRAGIGAAYLEIVAHLVDETVQHGIFSHVEDVVCLKTTPSRASVAVVRRTRSP